MDIKLGPRIASLRRAKSMTQEQLAGRIASCCQQMGDRRLLPGHFTFMPSGPRSGNQCGYPAAV